MARDETSAEQAVRTLLQHMGEDPDREGLVRTPHRVVRALEYLTRGYQEDPKVAINGALFTEEDYQEIILCRDLDFYSLCEHHLLPFNGKAHVGYLPHRRIVGLSKIARMVEIFARRLQVQERLTTQIARTIMDEIEPLGVAVVLEAEHLCMRMRGVEKQNSYVTTSAMLGVFRTHQETRHEFMTLLRNGRFRPPHRGCDRRLYGMEDLHSLDYLERAGPACAAVRQGGADDRAWHRARGERIHSGAGRKRNQGARGADLGGERQARAPARDRTNLTARGRTAGRRLRRRR